MYTLVTRLRWVNLHVRYNVISERLAGKVRDAPVLYSAGTAKSNGKFATTIGLAQDHSISIANALEILQSWQNHRYAKYNKTA